MLLTSCGNEEVNQVPKSSKELLQESPTTSMSNLYIATFPIMELSPGPNYPVWVTTISSTSNNKILFWDNQSKQSGYHSSYWQWNNKDQLFVYNSDDGSAFAFIMKNDNWTKIELNKSNISEFQIPPLLYKEKFYPNRWK